MSRSFAHWSSWVMRLPSTVVIHVLPVHDPDSFERLNEMIRMRAYELYEKRGRGEGLGLEAQDWLQAEQEVMEQYRKRTA